MVCEPGKFIGPHCDEDMFLRADLGHNHLLSAPFIAGVVKHSIQSVLDRAKDHDGMKHNFSAYQAEFILGVCCPETRKYHIYQYAIIPGKTGGAEATMDEVPMGKVAVIGMKDVEQKANEVFADAVKNSERTDTAILDFLKTSIQDQNDIGIFGIGFPAFLYKLTGIRLEREERKDQSPKLA
jgi:hypothetical protein